MTSLAARINQAVRLAGFESEITTLYKSDSMPNPRRNYYVKTGKKQGIPSRVPTEEHGLLIERYKNGESLHAIGITYGLTRERIRQILKSYGICREDGGMAVKSLLNSAEKFKKKKNIREKQERHCQSAYGCSLEFRKSMGEYKDKNSPYLKFITQRNTAKKRNIQWELSLKEWWDVWQESGKWELRGLGSGKYVMARHADSGPYSLGNVQIVTHNENSRQSREMDHIKGRWTNNVNLSELALKYGIKVGTLYARLKRGMNLEKALTHPVQITSRIY